MTTTMLETFDTQMLDYQNDLDVSMHLSSSDPWLQDDRIMEDDGSSSHLEPTNVSIEVDMEPYNDDRNTEYDMVDGSENYEPDAGELLDVEVYDASRAHSPTITHDDDSATMRASDLADPAPVSLDIVEPLISGASPYLLPTELPRAISTPDVAALPIMSPISREEPSSVPPTYHTTPASAVEVSPLYTAELTGDIDGVDHELDSVGFAPEQNHFEEHEDVDSQHTDIKNDCGHPDSGVESLHTTANVAAPLEDQSDTYQHNTEEQQNRALENEASAASAGDPHEISEGVYIDPPPAVLLSLLSADQPEICLFNVPSKSDPTTPSVDGVSFDHQTFTVLLAHLPTLYYEPLSSVFEALRQEEFIAPHFELANSELVLEAYDLQLAVSEDNIYAREISLHDLNVLHDGSITSGPLRLRLQATVPRFIVRYRMLQDEVAQLAITDSKETSSEHPPEEQQDQGNETQPQIQTQLDTENFEDEENQETHQKDQQDVQATEDTADTYYSIEEPPTTYDHKAQAVENDARTEDSTRDDDLEYVDVSKVEETETEAVHEITEVDASVQAGNLTQHQEHAAPHNEEGEDEHGETLPDEPGYDDPAQDISHDSPDSLHESNLDVETTALDHGESTSVSADSPRHVNTECTEDIDSHHLISAELSPRLYKNISQESAHSGENVSNSYVIPALWNEADRAGNQAGSSTTNQPDHAEVFDAVDAEGDTYEPEFWDEDLDGEGELDTTWEAEHDTASNESSVTLSSKTSSKRNIDEVEHEEGSDAQSSLPSSPGLKRPRVE